MSTKHVRRRALFAAALIAITGGLAITASSAQAAQTGATATKNCTPATPPNFYTLGSVIPCQATFTNQGETPAVVTRLDEQAPWIDDGDPGNGPFVPLSCTNPDNSVVSVGSTMNPGVTCSTAFNITVPNDPALCNTVFSDQVRLRLSYTTLTPILAASAAATASVVVVCRPSITVTKVADELSKPTDPVHYTIQVCNTGLIPVTKGTVSDSLVGDISANFAASIPAGQCDAPYSYDRTATANDPDPIINTVTANYSAGAQQASATASDSTNLFYPGVGVTKNCGPLINEVGGVSNCTIVVTNTSSGDSPNLVNGTINDTLSGDLLAAGNPNVTSSTCSSVLATGANCTITTARTILASDPNPVVNTVNVHYNPEGFPNSIDASASATVATVSPSITVTKNADELSKIGDPVHYRIEVCNSGTFPVNRVSVNDSLVGDITSNFAATLAPAGCSAYEYDRTVVAGDSDPLSNTVMAIYANAGAVQASATASDTTNLFQPSLTVSKNCSPDPIQVGQAELCEIIVTNTSSADAPALNPATISDSLTGDLLAANAAVLDSTCGAPLAALGSSCTIHTSRAVLAGDPNPLVNTVNVNYHPAGFPNDIRGNASDSVRIVSPSITLSLTATPLSKIGSDPGDAVTYTLTVCNTSSFAVTRTSVLSAVLGNLDSVFPATLAPAGSAGDCATVTRQRNPQPGDPDPLVVAVTANYSGFIVTATATASANTNLFQPSVAVSKNCSPDPIQVGATETCTIVISNTSSADTPTIVKDSIVDTLSGTLSPIACATLASGSSCTFTTTRVVLSTDPNPLVNTVTVHYHPTGFPNDLTAQASDSVVVQSGTGCTPGYWKQSQHFSSWKVYTPTTTWTQAFGLPAITIGSGKNAITNPTLLQALNANGGGVNAFARFAVNALLDATSTTNPDYSVAQVQALVDDALTAGGLSMDQVTNLFSSAPGVVNDNCRVIIPS